MLVPSVELSAEMLAMSRPIKLDTTALQTNILSSGVSSLWTFGTLVEMDLSWSSFLGQIAQTATAATTTRMIALIAFPHRGDRRMSAPADDRTKRVRLMYQSMRPTYCYKESRVDSLIRRQQCPDVRKRDQHMAESERAERPDVRIEPRGIVPAYAECEWSSELSVTSEEAI